MFEPKERVLYRHRHRQRGLDIVDQPAVFAKKTKDGRAIILIKQGTEFTKRRKVHFTFLRKA